MTITLDRLPFDVLFFITSCLGFDDIVRLAHTCRQLRTLLKENGICRKAIEAEFQHTKEAILAAQEKDLTYCDAFEHIQERRDAFSTAHPYSARVIGEANDFCYRQGMLCILRKNTIRIFDAHAQEERTTISLSPIVDALSEPSASSENIKLSILYYNEDIVTIHLQRRGRQDNSRILAINTALNASEPRLIEVVQLESTHKLFARHTSRYLYYGTYSSVGSQGHYEWEIHGVSFDKRNHPLPSTPLQLCGFFGTDLGSTIALEIHAGHFYAVSSQTSFEVEEIDWTSFYHCIRFPLNNPKPEFLESNKKLWRRQHDEGVIHDSWADLSLQVDESTNNLVIVEARREYQKSLSRQVRTYYISEFVSQFDTPYSSSEGSPLLEASTGPMLPWGDAYVQTLDSTNNPNYAPAEPRYNKSFHPEVPRRSNPGRSFILARTKFRAYNNSCASFLDIVEDDMCCNDSLGPCVRLRIGSRRVAPLDWKNLEMSTPQLLTLPALTDDVAYRHSAIRMWPPRSSRCPCSKRLHEILNPPLQGGPTHNRSITGVLDERSLVYMIRSGRSYSPSDDNASGIIVMVNFNRGPLLPRKNEEDKSREQEVHTQSNTEWHWVPKACKKGKCKSSA